MTLPPGLYWRFRAASSDLRAFHAEQQIQRAKLLQAVKDVEDAILAVVPEFDRTKNHRADDATCTLTVVEG